MSEQLGQSEEDANSALVMRVALEGFEGPLDLLLHLIQKHELDIRDIPIRFVTEEYLRYLDEMVRQDLGVAGEYLVMAATLLQMKSQSILPKDETEDEDDGLDPREELIRRLLEYQRFKHAAQGLAALTQLSRDVFARPEAPTESKSTPASLADIEPPNLFELVDVFRSVIGRRRPVGVHEVTRHELSIKDGIHQIADALDRIPRRTLRELVEEMHFPDPTHATVIAFMATLEMAKLRMVRIFQLRLSSDDLIVERAVLSIRDVALSLDFSDPDNVMSREEAAQEGEPLPVEDFDEDAELEARRNRPRKRRGKLAAPSAPIPAEPEALEPITEDADGPYDDADPQPLARTQEGDGEDADSLDDAMLAFVAIRPDVDDYDVDAILAYAERIGRVDDSSEDVSADSTEDEASDDAAIDSTQTPAEDEVHTP